MADHKTLKDRLYTETVLSVQDIRVCITLVVVLRLRGNSPGFCESHGVHPGGARGRIVNWKQTEAGAHVIHTDIQDIIRDNNNMRSGLTFDLFNDGTSSNSHYYSIRGVRSKFEQIWWKSDIKWAFAGKNGLLDLSFAIAFQFSSIFFLLGSYSRLWSLLIETVLTSRPGS